MPLKQALGNAAVPVAGGVALAAVIAIGVVLVTQKQPQDTAGSVPVTDGAILPQAPQATASTSTSTSTSAPTEDIRAKDAPTTEPAQVAAQDTNKTAVTLPALTAPTVDVVRIPQSGLSTIAGQAEAGSQVVIYIDGQEMARSTASASGEYVALFDIPAVDRPREMQVFAMRDDARQMADASVVIAPFLAAPVAQSEAAEVAQVIAPDGSDATAPDGSDATAPQLDAAQVDATSVAPMVTAQLPSPDSEVPSADAPKRAQPTVMIADDTGVKIFQSAAPFDGVSIDAITYDPKGAVFASGRGQANFTVRLYLDTDQLIDTQVDKDGQWRVELPVKAGIYSLRADMIDDTGKVLSRVQIPFKREDVSVLATLSGASEPASQQEAVETDSASDVATDSPEVQTPTAQDSVSAASASAATQSVPTRIASVTVQPGNTLWGIASDTYGDGFLYARVFNANVAQIIDPDLIYPGQVFVIPNDVQTEAQ